MNHNKVFDQDDLYMAPLRGEGGPRLVVLYMLCGEGGAFEMVFFLCYYHLCHYETHDVIAELYFEM